MSETTNTPMPKLEMGEVVGINTDGEFGIACNEAIIFVQGDEGAEIRLQMPNAPKVAEQLVRAANCHADLLAALQSIASGPFGLHTMYLETARAAIAKATGAGTP